ncbi:unnamed protein product [Knipowitschia caucasica]|uniref:Uncharacterized protein n=1 Tax=Knipowitschia caucasica TaxID=637954 RepID=A0AAV2LKA0_KNICA
MTALANSSRLHTTDLAAQTVCRGCFWTGSYLSTCWYRSWFLQDSEHACTSLNQACKTPISGTTKRFAITR